MGTKPEPNSVYKDVEDGFRHHDMHLVLVRLESLGLIRKGFESARFWSLRAIQALIEHHPATALERLEQAKALEDWDAEYFSTIGQDAVDAFGSRKLLFFKRHAEEQHRVMQDQLDELKAQFC